MTTKQVCTQKNQQFQSQATYWTSLGAFGPTTSHFTHSGSFRQTSPHQTALAAFRSPSSLPHQSFAVLPPPLPHEEGQLLPPENRIFGENVTELLSKFREVPAGSKVKEVFLWELIFNATCALARMRRESLKDESTLTTLPELYIHIVPDERNNTLTIMDSGIGMTKNDLLKKLSTIPGYLQEQHMETIEKCLELNATDGGRGAGMDLSWIFDNCMEHRLSFFAAYMVSSKISITTKHNSDLQYKWESDGGDSYTIAQDTSGDVLVRGTKVTLFLKEDALVYLEEHKLKGMVETYPKQATHTYPIYISVKNNKKLILDIVKEVKVPFNILEREFEALRKRFQKILGKSVKKVVLTDRLFEVSSFLSVDKTLEINPRHQIIQQLQKLDAAKQNDDEVEAVVVEQFSAALGRIFL